MITHMPVSTDAKAFDEEDIVKRACIGDIEAFGVLISEYRSKVYRWANIYTLDWYLAEEIAQESFIKLFLNLRQLNDPVKFKNWLYQVVKNQAFMKLRRGGQYHKETPMEETDLEQITNQSMDNTFNILFFSKKSFPEYPDDVLIRHESKVSLSEILECLNERERFIMNAYLNQIEPKEIAAIMNTSSGNVYSHLHRSKEKIRRYLKSSFDSSVNQRSHSVSMLSGKLKSPYSMLERITGLMKSRGNTVDITSLMGESGFAFRLKISNKTTFADAAFVFDWKEKIKEILNSLGYDPVFHAGINPSSPIPLHAVTESFPLIQNREDAIKFIRESIDYGSPILFFDTYVKKPFVHEWNLIYAYNDFEKTIRQTDVIPPFENTQTYEQLASSPIHFLCAAKKGSNIYRKKSLQDTLESIIFMAKYGDNYSFLTPYLSYTSGIEAYTVWIEHLKKGWEHTNHYGHKYLAAVYANARSFAGPYLRFLIVPEPIQQWIDSAASLYEESTALLCEMSTLCPLSDHKIKNYTPQTLKTCIEILTKVQNCEENAINYLESACNYLNKTIRT
ncbi:MAG: RNA polymerase sigma factor [Bacillota bacterium]